MSETTLNHTAVQEVTKLAQQAGLVQRLTFGDREFTDRALHRVNTDPELVKPAEFYTLDGFADYLEAEPGAADAIVHVVSPVRVEAFSRLTGRDKNLRNYFAAAVCRTATMAGFSFNSPVQLEALNIALQTCFDPTQGDIAGLRKFCASVRSTREIGTDDDGVSQAVQAKAGIAAVHVTPVSNPWLLAPWRTFAEIPQPTSFYVLRFKESEGAPIAGLYETGDASWQVEAVKRIAAHLRGRLTGWRVLG